MTTTKTRPLDLVAKIRDDFEQLAEQNLNNPGLRGHVLLVLADRRPDLSPWARGALWDDVRDAYQQWADAENPDVVINFDLVEPELRDELVYAEAMRAALDEQLDQLIDNYVVRKAGAR